MVTNEKELLQKIHEFYGHSNGWLSDLANELQIPTKGASQLAQEAGYRRHKLVKNVSLEEFVEEPYAKYLIRKRGLVI